MHSTDEGNRILSIIAAMTSPLSFRIRVYLGSVYFAGTEIFLLKVL